MSSPISVAGFNVSLLESVRSQSGVSQESVRSQSGVNQESVRNLSVGKLSKFGELIWDGSPN